MTGVSNDDLLRENSGSSIRVSVRTIVCMAMDRQYIITFPDSLEVWDSSVQSTEYSAVTVTGYV